MTATIAPVPGAVDVDASRDPAPPRLLPGVELLGRASGSGLKDPPYLIRRSDEQIVQLSELLYEIASRMDGRELSDIAQDAGAKLELRISPEQIAYVAEQKLAPLAIIAYRDGSVAPLRPKSAILGLRARKRLLRAEIVNAVAGPLRLLFVTPLVVLVAAALVALDIWLFSSGLFGPALDNVVRDPGVILALLGATLLSYIFHEFGHASACRYGGARPGRIGAGIYIVWPAFFTDVTDSYRLSRAGRLRVDLGGIYFNILIALSAAGGYLASGFRPLLILSVTQQMIILDQFMPWMRLDGYHVISDLIGVPDLFARIGPVLASLKPGSAPSPRVTELKRWARAAVTVWVLSTLTALIGMLVLLGVNVTSFLRTSWESIVFQVQELSSAVAGAHVLAGIDNVINVVLLLLPVGAATFTYLLLCRGFGGSLARRRTRRELTLAAARPTAEPAGDRERALPQPVT